MQCMFILCSFTGMNFEEILTALNLVVTKCCSSQPHFNRIIEKALDDGFMMGFFDNSLQR